MFRYIEDRWDTLGSELHYDGALAVQQREMEDADDA